MSKPQKLSVEHLIQQLQESNAELIRQNNELKQRVVGLMNQIVVNCAMGLYVRGQATPESCLTEGLAFARACDKFLPEIDEVKEQFNQPTGDKPADSTAH